ncbi:MAG: 2'-5' RNA ligase family protein [Firmicutes bacterium]|nr:2'-5' RNA ligase family protein [Bacillota bacterium]
MSDAFLGWPSSALIIPVTLPSVIETLRQRYDLNAAFLPAHVTISFPFAPQKQQKKIIPVLKPLIRQFSAFDLVGTEVSTFEMDTERIIILKIAVSKELEQLCNAVWSTFRQYPPYEGKHKEVVPHITLARVARNEPDILTQLAALVCQNQTQMQWHVSTVQWIGRPRCVKKVNAAATCRTIATFHLLT